MEVSPIDYECRECGSVPGEKCYGRKGKGSKLGYYHQVRSFDSFDREAS